MKKLAAMTATGALALAAFAGTAAAVPNGDPAPKAYGAVIINDFNAPFGQLWVQVKNGVVHSGATPAGGTRAFLAGH